MEFIAYSVGGEAGHEDVAFLPYAIRFVASEFTVYSEDDWIDTKLLLEYDYEDRTDIKIKENWYQIRICLLSRKEGKSRNFRIWGEWIECVFS